MNPRVGTTFRDMRGIGDVLDGLGPLGGVGTPGCGRSLGEGFGDGVGGCGVAMGGRITHLLLRLCHAASKSAARLRVTGF